MSIYEFTTSLTQCKVVNSVGYILGYCGMRAVFSHIEEGDYCEIKPEETSRRRV